jgi:hypothetical protein
MSQQVIGVASTSFYIQLLAGLMMGHNWVGCGLSSLSLVQQ